MRILRNTKIVTHIHIDWDKRLIEFTRQTRKYVNGFWETEPRQKSAHTDITFSSFGRLMRAIDRIGVMQVIDIGNGRIMRNWFRFMSEDAKPGVYKYSTMTMTILPDLRMKIELTESGRAIAKDYIEDGMVEGAVVDILCNNDMGTPMCNGWTLDPDDGGRCCITQKSLDDNGEIDWQPGDVCWTDPMYAIRSWVQTAYERGFATFGMYYMGDLSLENQAPLIG